jgi:hypothetical protein
MKFLIFNIIVFCSLGYLLTSQPNENFSEWAGNTKDKLSQISKKEVIETIKKATGEKNQIIEVNKSEDIKNKKSVNENSKNILVNNSKNISSEKDNSVKKPVEIKQIIKNVIAEKKLNEKKLKSSNIENKKDINESEILAKIQNQKGNQIEVAKIYMTNQERQSLLSELITDMELYHLNNLSN